MASRKFRVDHSNPDTIAWRDSVTNTAHVVCNIAPYIDAVSDSTFREAIIAAIRNGITQYVQDAGALPAGSSVAQRVAEMREKVLTVESGNYRLGQRGGMVDSDVFAIMVELGMIKGGDTPENRAKWRDAKKSQRDVFRRHPAVAELLAERARDDGSADAAVNSIFGD
jgi:hypothetical protein